MQLLKTLYICCCSLVSSVGIVMGYLILNTGRTHPSVDFRTEVTNPFSRLTL